MSELEAHFKKFAEDIVGNDVTIETPYGTCPLVYADWAASGRMYGPIEDEVREVYGPMLANTHTESNATGTFMTHAYNEAREKLKRAVGATDDDALIPAGSGMTGAVTLLQRILELNVPEKLRKHIAEDERPVVFVSQMEHHSNQTTWNETAADVEVIYAAGSEPFDLKLLERKLKEYGDRPKFAAVTAASNVTGVRLPVHDIARLMHENGGYCFVDYTCAAPYDAVAMRPKNLREKLDAIYFSPHKFLGGPQTPGILVLDKALYERPVPDRPGGGTVLWTDPWGGRSFIEDIEVREDGGTPPILGLIRAGLAIDLKHEMGIAEIAKREEEIAKKVFEELSGHDTIRILDAERRNRLPVFSLSFENLHYNLVVCMLNDRYGIQVRGGCACAGTYGHVLFDIGPEASRAITCEIDAGNIENKPGFVRASFHPTMDDEKVTYILDALKGIAHHGNEWRRDYVQVPKSDVYKHKSVPA